MFRNLTLFRFSADAANSARAFKYGTANMTPLRQCGPLELSATGYVSPLGRGNDQLAVVTPDGGAVLLCIATNEKLLPASVVNEAVDDRTQAIATREGRAIGPRERKRIKDEVIGELLPQAFTNTRRTMVYLDLSLGWVIVDTASRKEAERCLNVMRESLGSFPAMPLAPEVAVAGKLTDWLAGGAMPEGFVVGDECELRDPATTGGGVWSGRKEDLDSEEVHEHLRGGKRAYRLGLQFNNRMGFVLGEDLVVRKLRFFDHVLDEMVEAKDERDELLARFYLMVSETSALLFALADTFGIPRPESAA